jgi:hypothetical protein
MIRVRVNGINIFTGVGSGMGTACISLRIRQCMLSSTNKIRTYFANFSLPESAAAGFEPPNLGS